MTSTQAIKAGLRGKALRITHHYGDLLWQVALKASTVFHCIINFFSMINGFRYFLRESVEGSFVPNAGFFKDVVFEDPAFLSSCEASDSCKGANDAISEQQSDVQNEVVEGAGDITVNSDEIVVTGEDASKDGVQQVATDVSHLDITNSFSPEALDDKDFRNINAEDVDTLLDKCLLQALHRTVKDKDLPMPGSTLW